MPKMKTNRTASKKVRITGKGKVKRGKAYTSHNTAKKSAKQRRHLRKMTMVDATNSMGIAKLLPNGSK